MSPHRRLVWWKTLLLCWCSWSASALPSHAAAEDPSPELAARQNIVTIPPDASPERIIRAQLQNPVGILAVLLIIGGETIRKACAQLMSGLRFPYGEKDTDDRDQKYFSFTPVAFSFGWVGYAFNALASAFGDGSLMPVTDVPCLVLTVGGQWKNNENWTIGRLLRDLELQHKREVEGQTVKGGMGIYFYKSKTGAGKPTRDRIWWLFIVAFTAQFGLAVTPLFVHGADRRNWIVLMVTAAGTALALLTGSMPQWGEEKYSARRVTKDDGERKYVLTRGNGHSHVFVIQVTKDTYFKNLDDMATMRPFRSVLTRIATVVLAVLWIFLLIVVGGLEEDGWFLLGIGLVGMVHNVIVANWRRLSVAHGLPLYPGGPDHVDRSSVFRALFDVEFGRGTEGKGVGKALIPIFLPAGLKFWQQSEWEAESRRQNPTDSSSKLESSVRKGLADHAQLPTTQQLRPTFDSQGISNDSQGNDQRSQSDLQPQSNSQRLETSTPSEVGA